MRDTNTCEDEDNFYRAAGGQRAGWRAQGRRGGRALSQIGETGAGSYFYRYRLGDRRREIGLGSRDKVSLADACKAAKAWAVLRDEGHDPIETRRRERADNLAKSHAQQPITFKQMADTKTR
jgi:dipeptidyl aminopeptidase/acylaminoacyl peptidase